MAVVCSLCTVLPVLVARQVLLSGRTGDTRDRPVSRSQGWVQLSVVCRRLADWLVAAEPQAAHACIVSGILTCCTQCRKSASKPAEEQQPLA